MTKRNTPIASKPTRRVMITDAEDLQNGESLSADICISGAGAAGITIASDLISTGLDVILLEAGPLDVPPGSETEGGLYEGEVEGLPVDLCSDRKRRFGGTTGVWGGWCIPLEPNDFKYDGYPSEIGWPIEYDDLEPYYRKAMHTCDLGGLKFDANVIADREDKPLLKDCNSGIENIVYLLNAINFGEKYRPDLKYSTNVQVFTNANLVNISKSNDPNEIKQFDCKVINGPSFNVEAEKYVLAMGGIENPRLLLASNDKSERGVANKSGLVGKYFMQHPHFNWPSYLLLKPFDDSFYRTHPAPIPGTSNQSTELSVRGALKIDLDQRIEEHLPNAACTLEPVVMNRDLFPFYQIAYQNISSLPPLPSDNHNLYRLSLRAEQKPLEESKVALTDERDELGIPRVKVDWRVAESDKTAYRKYLDIFCKEISNLEIGRRSWVLFDTETQFQHPNFWGEGEIQFPDSNIWGGGHHMGTTRMSEKPDKGVVNENCRAHDIDNLYIAGSSVFPTGGYANPTFSIVALGHRLADHLRL